ncbi:MAG: FHA domain-containing protein [Deltaproteobacteria bacterium]|nr:FHA domain-containing protein [Deltaproteobacteria bacterium]
MPSLQVTTNDGQIFNYPVIKDRITLGRSKDNDLVISDNTVSRHHAEIRKSKDGYLLIDLGSYNGTRLNGKPIQTAPLTDNDLVQIGLTKMVFFDRASIPETPSDSVLFAAESEDTDSRFPVVATSPFQAQAHGKSSELLLNLGAQKPGSSPGIEEAPAYSHDQYLSVLERTNKVLFVLYEISRQLNEIHDLNELLTKIMDLIFMVIDADFGFLVLLGDEAGEKLIPVVVKHRMEADKSTRQIKASRTLIRRVIRDKVALLTSNAMEDARLDPSKSVVIQKIKSAMCVPLWRKDKIIGVIQLDSTRLQGHFTNEDLELLKAIASQMALVIEQASLNEQIRQEEQVRSRLERFHSPQVIEMILTGDQEAKDNIMEPKELVATILFADIVDFTGLAEQLPPQEVNIILNRFFSAMTDIIFTYDGTLDKYIGDGLMAVFGAPMQKEDDAKRAIVAALEMREALKDIMKELEEEKRFDIRIGINTGKVVAGNIGSPKRLDYTVIGDPVNIASRLESIALPNQILIGEATHQLIKSEFNTRVLGPKKVKGKTSTIMVYEVLGRS